MYKYPEVEEEFFELSEKKIDVMALLMKYLSYWKWFVLSVVIFMSLAALYVYFTLPTYQIATTILFKDDRKGGSTELNMEHNMGVVTRRNNAENEVEILKKLPTASDVVIKNHLYATYYEMAPILGLNKVFPNFPKRKSAVVYGNELPVILSLPYYTPDTFPAGNEIEMTSNGDGSLLFEGEYKGQAYRATAGKNDTTVQLPFGKIRLLKSAASPTKARWFKVLIQHPQSVAGALQGSLEVKLTSRNSSVANVTMTAPNREMGRKFLEDYIMAYNSQGISDQLELAEKTAKEIDRHLAKLSNELSSVEDQAQEFRQAQGLTDIASQANLYNSQLASARQRKTDIETQHGIVTSLLNSVSAMRDHSQLIPANTGIQSVVLNAQITTYNDLVLQRNRLARIASSSNQSMIDLNNQLESTFNSVISGLRGEKNTLEIQLKDINNEYYRNNAMVRAIPQQERAFSDIKRQQNIKEELFLYLLQKKEERYMNMTAIEPNSKIVDQIHAGGVVWPKTMIIFALFFTIGLISPIIVINIRDMLRYQVDNKEDLQKISNIPILGEIPAVSITGPVMVQKDNNDVFNEMIRLLRANFLFVADSRDKKVVNIQSSISGEGKSFVSLNLAASLALLNKRVLLVELDIRKPKLGKLLGLDPKNGMTLYLTGYLNKTELIKESGILPNLSVILAGSIPPNPNELMAKPELDELINELRDDYDFIIVDTSPVGMVSDGLLLNRIADVNLFVARAGVTSKKFVEDADRYFNDNKLKKMYFILNSVNMARNSYKYGIYKKYGYGYG